MSLNVNKELVSIIVPVYNCKSYLEGCIKSIVAQTYENIEVILVDDGSSDGSGELCDEYKNIYKKISVIHKPNGGVSSARNMGIDNANGKYIMFVDSDDMICSDMCEYLVSAMDDQCDLVVSEFYRSNLFELNKSTNKDVEYSVVQYSDMSTAFYTMLDKGISNCPYAKLFRKNIIENQRYDITKFLGEDLLFNLDYLDKVKGNIKISSYCGYMYYIANTGSITNKFKEEYFDLVVDLNERLHSFANKYSMGENIITRINQVLVEDIMAILQNMYFSNKDRKYKRSKALEWLNNEKIKNICKNKYELSLINRPFYYLIKHKKERLLYMFLKFKKVLKKIARK